MMLQMVASEGANMGLAWFFCILGGAFMGSYPVFVKVPRVVAARVSPIIFQSYKSFWVFALVWIFILVNHLRAKPLFAFTWWAVASAALWVPAGFATIAAVSMCGVATTAVLACASNSVIQFLASLMLDQAMKRHGPSNVPLAPLYLVGGVLGMVGLILSPRVQCAGKADHIDGADKLNRESLTASTLSSVSHQSIGLEEHSVLVPEGSKQDSSRREFVVGVLLACMSGVFAGMKFAVKSIGHSMSLGNETVDSEFGIFESFMLSFGVGCALVTPVFVGIFALWEKGIQHREFPSMEFPVMKIFGFLAGAVWLAAYFCLQAANDIGGQGAMGPAGNASQLITAGLWGILYYREIRGPAQIACWVLSATWTAACVILLSNELENVH
jgi:hypothetical protein